MYPSPQKSSTSHVPPRTPKSRSVTSRRHNRESAHHSARLPSPAPTAFSDWDCIDNPAWKTFNWSLLNTPANKIRTVKPKSIDALRRDCNKKLNTLDTSPFKTESLKLLIAGIQSVIDQKWKTLLVYFNEDHEITELERPWSHKEYRKWDIVSFLVRMAISYEAACATALRDDVRFCTDKADKELLGLVGDLLDLGSKAAEYVEDTIVVKEWERKGTLALMAAEGLSVGDTVEVRGGTEDVKVDDVKVEEDSKV